MDIYEVYTLNGKYIGCTSDVLEIGQEIQFATFREESSPSECVTNPYIITDISHNEKFYFVEEKESVYK